MAPTTADDPSDSGSVPDKYSIDNHKSRIIADIDRVAEQTDSAGITLTQYKEHGEYGIATVRSVFGSFTTARAQADVAQPTDGGAGNPQYTDGDLVAALHDAASRVDPPLTFDKYRSYCADHSAPAGQTLQYRFGSWTNALREAGLDEYITKQDYTTEEISAALEVIATRVDPPLTRSEYSNLRDDTHPSARQITSHLGSWTNALREAGLDEYITKQGYTEKEVCDALRSAAAHTDDQLTTTAYKSYRDGHGGPAISAVYSRFDSWTDALEAAGIES